MRNIANLGKGFAEMAQGDPRSVLLSIRFHEPLANAYEAAVAAGSHECANRLSDLYRERTTVSVDCRQEVLSHLQSQIKTDCVAERLAAPPQSIYAVD